MNLRPDDACLYAAACTNPADTVIDIAPLWPVPACEHCAALYARLNPTRARRAGATR